MAEHRGRVQESRHQPQIAMAEGGDADQYVGAFTFGQVAPWNLLAIRLLPLA